VKPVKCPVCRDQGIVELAGRRTVDGYSRGSAPCQWCEAGHKLRAYLVDKGEHPLGDYSMVSLADPVQANYHAVTKEEALAEWETCDHEYQPIGPPQARPWAKDSIQWKTCPKCGKEEVDHLPLSSDHSPRRTTP